MSCAHFEKDLSFIVQDYGPAGFVGNVSMNLAHGLKVGSLISLVARSDQEIVLHVKDAVGNHLITIGARVAQDVFVINSFLNQAWGPEERPKNTARAGARTVISLLYDVDGYRVVVNDAQIAFYKHRSSNLPKLLEVPSGSQVFKLIYLTPVDIVP